MAFDAGMMAAVVHELMETLPGARIEKINQPEKDEVLFTLHSARETKRLLLSASSGSARLCLIEAQKGKTPENPSVPPLFCTLLRKHLTSARIESVTQPGFERVAEISFDARDEMGFPVKRRLICEVLGKFSNLIFTDGEGKILGVLKPVDFSSSEKRQLLPGMRYELPPPQEKADPRSEERTAFMNRCIAAGMEKPADKFLVENYLGVAPLTAREIVFLATGSVGKPLGEIDGGKLYAAFREIFSRVTEGRFDPCVVLLHQKPAEFAFFPIRQYGEGETAQLLQLSASAALSSFYSMRAAGENLRQRAQDILQLLKTAESRLTKKIALQQEELAACNEKESLREFADLITANLYALKKGDEKVKVINYYSPAMEEVEIALDRRLSPSDNAARYYKKYTKYKTAEQILTTQLETARNELAYLETVRDALSKAEGQRDLDEIRQELREAGYGKSKDKDSPKKPGKNPGCKPFGRAHAVQPPMEFRTTNGYLVLCGRNNLQNEKISFGLSEKRDWWFHVKNAPGSHVILCLEGGEEPPAADFTDAAVIAATYSSLGDGDAAVSVDYTQVRNLKKPPAAKPGVVIYHTNYDAFVRPDKKRCEEMRVK